MRNPWRFLAVITSAALFVAVAGCSKSNSQSGSDVKEVKIGALDPLSGTNATSGTDSYHGAQLAAEIINGKHPDIALPLAKDAGLPNLGGAKITLVKGDTKGLPDEGTKEATKLVTDSKVVGLVGAYQSAVTLTASKAAEGLRVPFVNGDSSSTSLTSRGLNYFFRTGPTDLVFGETFFSLLKSESSKIPHGIAILHTNDDFGKSGAKVTHQLADDNGYKVLADVGYDVAATDLTSQVQQIRAAKPDVLFVLSFVKDSILLGKTFKTLGYQPPMVMGYGAGFSDPTFVDGPENSANAEGFVRRTSWSPQIAANNPTARTVADMFQKEFKAPMTENSARSFTALMTLATAINNAKSTDADKVRSALQNTDVPGRDLIMPWDGVKFDDNHQNSGARGVLEQFQGGQWKVIYPNDVKSEPVVWPGPNAKG